MIPVTYLPVFVTSLFCGMPGVWKSRHCLLLCWLMVMQSLYPGRKTLAELARWTPGEVTSWRWRRVLKATYWDVHRLVDMKMVRQRDADDPDRTWGFVFAIARTWKTVEGKAIKDLVTHVPRTYFTRTWVPRIPAANGRRIFWLYSKRMCLRHIGDVTVVLRKTGRNVSPKHTKILVTNLAEVTPRYVVFAYQKRWAAEQINRELKSDLGMGEHQVSGEERRIENSFGIAVMAYLFLIRTCHEEIVPGQSWSVPQLQHAFRLRVITNQVAHNVKSKLAKVRKAA